METETKARHVRALVDHLGSQGAAAAKALGVSQGTLCVHLQEGLTWLCWERLAACILEGKLEGKVPAPQKIVVLKVSPDMEETVTTVLTALPGVEYLEVSV